MNDDLYITSINSITVYDKEGEERTQRPVEHIPQVLSYQSSTKHKVKPMAQNDPGWLHFMSMPKLKQNKIFGVGPIVHPDNVKVTKESYKNHGKKVKKILEPIQAYNSIQNLHMPFKLQPGVSNFISDYDPDPYVQDHLLHTCSILS